MPAPHSSARRIFMRFRFIASIGFAAALAAVLFYQPRLIAQAKGGAAKSAMPRTPDGHPDLQGFWSFANITPFERPVNLGEKTVLTEQEAAEFEKETADRSRGDENRQRGTAADVGRAYNDAWYDRGTRVAST